MTSPYSSTTWLAEDMINQYLSWGIKQTIQWPRSYPPPPQLYSPLRCHGAIQKLVGSILMLLIVHGRNQNLFFIPKWLVVAHLAYLEACAYALSWPTGSLTKTTPFAVLCISHSRARHFLQLFFNLFHLFICDIVMLLIMCLIW